MDIKAIKLQILQKDVIWQILFYNCHLYNNNMPYNDNPDNMFLMDVIKFYQKHNRERELSVLVDYVNSNCEAFSNIVKSIYYLKPILWRRDFLKSIALLTNREFVD